MRDNEEILFRAMVLTIALIAAFAVGRITVGEEFKEKENVYRRISCVYAKDAGRTQPDWCGEEKK